MLQYLWHNYQLIHYYLESTKQQKSVYAFSRTSRRSYYNILEKVFRGCSYVDIEQGNSIAKQQSNTIKLFIILMQRSSLE